MKMTELNTDTIRFIKFRYGEDVVGFVVGETKTHITIRRPLAVHIQNDFNSGRQLLEVREWLPPILTEVEKADIKKTDIMIITNIRESFKDEIVNLINYFYGVRPKKQITKALVDSANGENVIPFYGKDNSTKPN